MNKKYLLILIILVVLVAGGILTYNYLNSTGEGEPSKTEESASKKILSPTETYIEMKNKIEKTETPEELVLVLIEYATEEKVAQLEQSLEKMKKNPELAEFAFEITKSMPSITDIEDIEEEITENTAMLYITTKDPKTMGEITMVLENGVWKIELESWSTKSE